MARCAQGIEINSSYCGEVEQNGPLVGTVPLESNARMVFSSTRLTAVALTAVNGHIVAFLGTAHGHIRKVSDSFFSIYCYFKLNYVGLIVCGIHKKLFTSLSIKDR